MPSKAYQRRCIFCGYGHKKNKSCKQEKDGVRYNESTDHYEKNGKVVFYNELGELVE